MKMTTSTAAVKSITRPTVSPASDGGAPWGGVSCGVGFDGGRHRLPLLRRYRPLIARAIAVAR